MKICKQCKRALDEKEFRAVKSRSKGIRPSEPGTRPVCRHCESVLTQAYGLLKDLDAGRSVDEAKLDRVLSYYRMLLRAGCTLTNSAAQRLVGLYDAAALASAQGSQSAPATPRLDALYDHVKCLRERSYGSFDEADEVHKSLTPHLRSAGLYEVANDLIDEWFMEEDDE